jgi:hypothetical protein
MRYIHKTIMAIAEVIFRTQCLFGVVYRPWVI